MLREQFEELKKVGSVREIPHQNLVIGKCYLYNNVFDETYYIGELSDIKMKNMVYMVKNIRIFTEIKCNVKFKSIACIQQLTPTFSAIPHEVDNEKYFDVNTYNRYHFYELNYTNYNNHLLEK